MIDNIRVDKVKNSLLKEYHWMYLSNESRKLIMATIPNYFKVCDYNTSDTPKRES